MGDLPDTGQLATDDNVPGVVSVGVPVPGLYGTNQTLSFDVRFSEPVQRVGMPGLALDIGGRTVVAPATGMPAPDTVRFTYTVQDGDLDVDGIAVLALDFSAGTVQGLYGQVADTTLAGVGVTEEVKVDGVPPAVLSVEPLPTPRRVPACTSPWRSANRSRTCGS